MQGFTMKKIKIYKIETFILNFVQFSQQEILNPYTSSQLSTSISFYATSHPLEALWILTLYL